MSTLKVDNITSRAGGSAPSFPDGVSVTGVVTANSFSGDGSNLTNVGVDTATVSTSSLVVTGISTFDGGDVQFHGATAGRDLTLERSGNRVVLDDNFKASFGSAGHAQVYHSGGAMWFQNYTGNIEFQTPVGSTYDFSNGLINAQAGLTVTGNVSASSSITAATFYGDGSGLTNLPGGGGSGGEFTLSGVCGNIYSSEAGSGGTGKHNFFAGFCAGSSVTDGWNNFFAGWCAGASTTSARNNFFTGYGAGKSNTTGWSNFFVGYNAGTLNSTGWDNIFVGNQAGACMVSGCRNIFLGKCAGLNQYQGTDNIYLGNSAGCNESYGTGNIYMGELSGGASQGAFHNVFMGSYSGRCVTTGWRNVFIGQSSGRTTTSGGCNVAMGFNSLYSNTTGACSLSLGPYSGYSATTGTNNLFFGFCSGYGASGLCNVTTESNHIVMGNCLHTNALIQVSWTTVSDCRDKCIFGPVPHGRGFLQNITPVEYAFKNRETGELKDTEGKRRYGFTAQNVLEAEGENSVIVNADDPENLKLTSDHMVPVLVNAIKELSEEVDAIKARLDTLENA